jgi:mRNA-degrading endonuclease RelE of RelBE toxin-antitoxin system
MRDFRVLYQVRDEEILVLILRVAHRRKVYKR